MKVCFIAGTLGLGGAERQLLYMLQALCDVGIESRILCLTHGEPYESRIRELGIEVEWVGASKSRIARLFTIISNLIKRPADVLQSTHFYTNLYAASAGRSLRISNIGAIRSDLIYELSSNKRFGQLQLRLPGHLISNSQSALDRAVSVGIIERKIDLVRNVVEIPKKSNWKGGIANGIVNILFAGRLSSEKRPDLFVETAIRLSRKLPQIRFRFQIAGDGPMRMQLDKRITNLGYSFKQIEFLGYRDDLSSIYEQTDLLVLTSDHEGTPNVILEAMAWGIPVVATRVGGVPEIVDHERGVLVKSGDLDGLVSASAELISNPELRQYLGENGRRFTCDNHSLTNLGGQLSEIYAKLTRVTNHPDKTRGAQ